MKKILFLLLSSVILFVNISFWWWWWDDETQDIYNKEQDSVVDTNWLDDPIRNGTHNAVENVWWIAKADIEDSESAQNETKRYISNWINYFLWFLWLVVVIFIIKDGIILITSAWWDNGKKIALQNLKNYIIAIILIWVSYLIVSLAVYFVWVNS